MALEQRAGSARAEAWKHLADRTGLDIIRNLVSMLVQSEQFGTSVAKTLRVHSDTLRTKRVQEIEEKAAKLSVKLLFPLVLFIFPSLFVVVLGPAVILMADSFKLTFWTLIRREGYKNMDNAIVDPRRSCAVLGVPGSNIGILVQRRRTRVK